MMKTAINIFSVCQLIFHLGFIGAESSHFSQDCEVINVHNAHTNYMHVQSSESSIEIGFLLLNSTKPLDEIQIHIKFKDKHFGERHLEVYLSDQQLKLTERRKKATNPMIISHPLVPETFSSPSWYYLIIKFKGKYFSVSRPGSLAPFAFAEIDEIDSNSFNITVQSKNETYVTVNCQKGCPVFSDDIYNNLKIDLKWLTRFAIVLRIKNKTHNAFNQLKFGIKFSKISDTVNRNISYNKDMNNILYSSWKENGNLTLMFNDAIILSQETEKNKTFQIIVNEANNIEWTFNCEEDEEFWWPDDHTHGPTTYRTTTATIEVQDTHDRFILEDGQSIRSGEIAAWIVAALALCGVIMLGVTLFLRVSTDNNFSVRQFNNRPSLSGISEIEMISSQEKEKPKKSTFYASLRKPEEQETRRESLNITNISIDNLYPLKFEDSNSHREDQEDDDDKLESMKSNNTIISTF